MKTIIRTLLLQLCIFLPVVVLAQKPVSSDENLSIRAVTESPFESVRLSYNVQDETLYLLTRYGEIFSVDRETGTLTEVQSSFNHQLDDVQGLDISSSGEFFIVGNIRDDNNFTNTGIIKKGVVTDAGWEWTTVAETEPYPLSNTFFDHVMNGIVVSPDNSTLYINSGSRTDHGEVHSVNGRFPDLREAPLTSKVLQVPADGVNLLLENDIGYLQENGFIFTDGNRNSFSLAFNAEGELFATDNAGERDDPGELNWLREGHHYGFPWVIGGNLNPMQFEGYVPEEDLLLPTETASYNFFYNDPDYPAPPEDVTFTPAIPNSGPDAVNYRNPETGEILSAFEEDTVITSFTGHRAPLGLVFDNDQILDGEYTGDAFVMGFTSGDNNAYLLRLMDDPGEDLLHVELTKNSDGDGYEMTSRTIVSDFISPVDSELIGNKLYVVEHKNPQWLNSNATTRIWEITFPGLGTSTEDQDEIVQDFSLEQNYPNPFNPSTNIRYQLPVSSDVSLKVYDMLGREVETLVNSRQSAGTHQVEFDASKLASGVYLYRLRAGSVSLTRQMVLMK